jgi:hypothetical protein
MKIKQSMMTPDRASLLANNFVMRFIVALLACGLLFTRASLWAEPSERSHLFTIERNTNANVVQYDAQFGTDGRLNIKEPVIVYWVRLAEQGQIDKLNWIQKKFAYGFKVKMDRKSNTATLDMSADIGRLIIVQLINGEYRAITSIDDQASQVGKIFIHATGKGLSTRVDYIELFGTDLESGNETYEKIIP